MNSEVQRATWSLAAWVVLGPGSPAAAMTAGHGKTIDVSVAGRDVGLRVEMALADARAVVEARADPPRWDDADATALGAWIATGLRIERDGRVCPVRAAPAQIASGTDGARVVARVQARCPDASETATLIDGTLGPSDVSRVRVGGTVVRLDAAHPRAALQPTPAAQAALADPHRRRTLPALAWPWAVPILAAAAWLVLRVRRWR